MYISPACRHELSFRVREHLAQKRLSPLRFARQCGVPRSTLKKVLRCAPDLRFSTVKKICAGLGLPLWKAFAPPMEDPDFREYLSAALLFLEQDDLNFFNDAFQYLFRKSCQYRKKLNRWSWWIEELTQPVPNPFSNVQ